MSSELLLPTEPIGRVPRSPHLIETEAQFRLGNVTQEAFEEAENGALADTMARFEAAGSTIVTDGEQCRPNCFYYPLSSLENVERGGVVVRALPKLTAGPFRYGRYAVEFLRKAQQRTTRPVKQAVLAASALSMIYPRKGLPGYSREQFLCDLLDEVERDIRQCLAAGAYCVQIDFGEARLAIKLDPSLKLLEEFIEINNWVLGRFSPEERKRIGIHACPLPEVLEDPSIGYRSAEIEYEFLLPALLRLDAGRFYVQVASEKDRCGVLARIRSNLRPGQVVFAGVINPRDPRVETAKEVRDRVLEAAEYLPVHRMGTTDDGGFSPLNDDYAASRDIAFGKIKARVEGTAWAREILYRRSA